MTFAHPHLLWLLLVIAGLAGLEQRRRDAGRRLWPNIRRARTHATRVEAQPEIAGPERRWRLWAGLALLTAAIAQPRAGHVRRPVPPPPREIVIALDLSRSMLARDIKPSRLDHAKLLLSGFIDRAVNDRLGLVLFSSSAYLQLPISSDYTILTEMLPDLSPAYFPKSGTNFGAMIKAAVTAFSSAPDTERFLVVLSDGEAFDRDWHAPIAELKKRAIHVIALGVGTKAGDLIATPDGPVRAPDGSEVISHLNSSSLEELASATGGTYAAANTWIDLGELLKSPRAAGPTQYVTDPTQQVERFRWLALPALLLLGLSFWLEFPVKPSLRQLRPPTPVPAPSSLRGAPVAAAALAVLLGATIPWGHGQDEAEQQDEMQSDVRSPVRSLASLVSQRITGILEKRAPRAEDYVSLTIDIVAYGENMLRARQRFPVSIIDDANRAIEAGERLDPHGGDWNKLRADLQSLLKADTEPWKAARPEAAGTSDIEVGYDPNTEMKNDKHASGLRIIDPAAQIDAENAKATFVDSPAFGAMGGQDKPPAESDEPPIESDQQVVGGRKSSADAERDRHPELVLPLQKLEQVRRGDTPARLFEMLENNHNDFVAPTPEW